MTSAPSVDPDQLAHHIYRFASERAQRTSGKYGAQTIEPLAVKPTQEASK